jgi:hypothetical protein
MRALDHIGINDVMALLGEYTSIFMIIAFYDVPADAPGIKRKAPSASGL